MQHPLYLVYMLMICMQIVSGNGDLVPRNQFICDVLVKRIMERFYMFNRGYRLMYAASQPQLYFEFGDIATNILRRTQGVPVTNVGRSNELRPQNDFVFLIYILDPKTALTALPLPTKVSKYLSVVIILLPQLGQSDEEFWQESPSIMLYIFQKYFDIYVLEVTVCIYTVRKELELYGYNPYQSPHRCGDLTPILGKTISHVSDYWGSIYSRRRMNMNGCPIKVVTSQFPPYVLFRNSTDKGIEDIMGLEGEMLKVMAQKINFTIKIELSNRMGDSHVYNETSASGIYEWLIEKRANLTLGDTTCTPRRLKYLAGTQSYYPSDMYVVITPPSYTSIEILFLPLKMPLLILGGAIFILYLFLRKYINRLYSNNSPMSRALRNKFIVIGIYIMGLYRLCYESTYFSNIQTPPIKALPETIEDLHDMGYTFYYNYISQNYFETYASKELLALFTRLETTNADKLYEDQFSSKVGFVTKNTYFEYFLRTYGKHMDFSNVVKYPIYLEQCCMYFPANSYLLDPFNNLLMNLKSFGITLNIFNNFSLLSNQAVTKDTMANHKTMTWEPLSLFQLRGVFILWIILMSTFCLLLLIEHIILHFPILNNFYTNI